MKTTQPKNLFKKHDFDGSDVDEGLDPDGLETRCVGSREKLEGQLHGEADVTDELETELCNEGGLDDVTEEQKDKLHNEILHDCRRDSATRDKVPDAPAAEVRDDTGGKLMCFGPAAILREDEQPHPRHILLVIEKKGVV